MKRKEGAFKDTLQDLAVGALQLTAHMCPKNLMLHAGLLLLAGCVSCAGPAFAQRNQAGGLIGKYKLEIGNPRSSRDLRQDSRKHTRERQQVAEGRRLQVSDVPEAPTSVHGAQAGLRAVVVSWEAPEDNNSTIAIYEVTYNSIGAHGGVVTATGSPPPTSTNVTGLATGLVYTFAVRAINAVGAGAQSEQSAEVLLAPGAFAGVGPTVVLSTYAAGEVGTANVSFITSNPIPSDGHVIITFPSNFTSVDCSVALASGMDGGLVSNVSGYTVDVERDGFGSAVEPGTEVSVSLVDCVKNQLFEGESDSFPVLKTTLNDTGISVDEASSAHNSEDQPAAVLFTPGAFSEPPTVELDSLVAGHEGGANVTLALSNPLPADGNIFIEFPSEFSPINCSHVVATGIDGGLEVYVASDAVHTVRVQRAGDGSVVVGGSSVSLALVDGITNQLFEGMSASFPSVKTTLTDVDVAIDETSAEFNTPDRPPGVTFTPGAFAGVGPTVVLSTYAAGEVGTANVSFITSNSIPSDGHVIITFPSNFTSVDCSVALASGMDGGLVSNVSGYTVDVERDGFGSAVEPGTEVSVSLVDCVKNQLFEGESDSFPVLKTTLNDTGISVDEASSAHNSEDQPAAVLFTPGAFSEPPTVELDSLVAGHEGGANVTLALSNPLPADGNIFIEFPSEFSPINCSHVVATGIDGGLEVYVASDAVHTVRVQRAGDGSVVVGGSSVSLALVDGITNQVFEGVSASFPSVKTTLTDVDVAIDETSAEFNTPDRPPGVTFTPGAFAGVGPTVVLSTYAAGEVGTANISFITSNPIPSDGHVIITFPSNFTSVDCSVALASGMDGGLVSNVSGYTVDVERDGFGSAVEPGTEVSVSLVDCVKNQLFEGESDSFPVLKTTLNDTGISVDEASSAHNSEDQPAAVLFTPGAFSEPPTVELDSLVAGHEGGANVTLALSNPLPADGNIFIEFPSEFSSINCSHVVATGIDGGLEVYVASDAVHTVRVQRAGDGSVVVGGSSVSLALVDGITNQLFEGVSASFPSVKTTLTDVDVAIDETSAEFNTPDRPPGVTFTPGAFAGVGPTVVLSTYAAGEVGTANISFITSNPIPSDGHVIITFPSNFTSVDCSVALASGMDGGLVSNVSGYTVDVERDGFGSAVEPGTEVSVSLVDCVKNQLFEGESDSFPVLKTTLNDTGIPVDEASSAQTSEDRPAGVLFTPGAFSEPPTVELDSLVAGHEGGANVTLALSNPLPADGNIFIEFPSEFSPINCSQVVATGIDGGLEVYVASDAVHTVRVQRAGDGSVVVGGSSVSLALVDGITNQLFEGVSASFPSVKTTLTDVDVAIDETSAEFNTPDRPPGVTFTPGAFAGVGPTVVLSTYAAGEVGTANISFITSNPIPSDGHVIITFPSNFTSVDCSVALASGMDGGLVSNVSGYTVDVERDGFGSAVEPGTEVSVSLVDCVKNQLFEGESDSFPVLKTTLNDTGIPVDEASSAQTSEDRPAGVLFTPGAFSEPPTVELDSLVAGHEGGANVTLALSNPLPADGNIFIEFPSEFSPINCSQVVATGIDGGLEVYVASDAVHTVRVQRAGDGSVVVGGSSVSLALVDGITNQLFEGMSASFPSVKTTLTDVDVAIDETSAEFNTPDRRPGVTFTPGAFAGVGPTVVLSTYAAGEVGTANISFITLNPIPSDGHVIITFPSNFTSVDCSVALASGMDGGLVSNVSGYTVDVERDGFGSAVEPGTEVSVSLVDCVKNQLFEGESDSFPVLKTTLNDTGISVDEASSAHNSEDRPAAVLFTPGAFSEPPTVELDSLVAGHEGGANVTLALSNPLPADGNIFIEFPSEFSSINCSHVVATGIDGGLEVYVASDAVHTVRVQRAGDGSVVVGGSSVSLALVDGITNQVFEGVSASFPSVKTTLTDVDVAIDETSAEFNTPDRPPGVTFTPGAFAGVGPTVVLSAYAAGEVGTANVSFITSNPIPSDGHVIITFPSNFTSVDCSVALASGMDGGLVSNVSGYTVDVERDGFGSAVEPGTEVSVSLVDCVKNQLFEGESDSFPVLKTTLNDTGISVDEASSAHNSEDRPAAVLFTPGAFSEPPTVELDSLVAGHEGGANVTLALSNPLPADGNIFIEFPSEFSSINCSHVVATGIDGGLEVYVASDAVHTVRVQRAGDGSVVEAGASVSLALVDGITNQLFEGMSASFPSVKTTLTDVDVAIDDSREGPDLPDFSFLAGTFPVVGASLQYDVALMETSITFSLTIANPLPVLALVQIEFPPSFPSVSPMVADSAELGTVSVNGTFSVSVQRDGLGDIVPTGTSVALILSTVINRGSVGDTGNFSVTTFTDSSMNNRIDVGVAASVVVGKQVLSTAAAFGSSSVAVAAQNKRWTFFGHGVALEDKVKWVNSSATSDEDCNWNAEEINIDVFNGSASSAIVTFSESSETTGPLQLCYQFSNGSHPFKLYPAINIDVFELYSVQDAEQGSISLSVVGYAKVLTLSGFGNAEFDEAKWLLGSTNCSSARDVAPLASGGDGEVNAASVSSTFQASFEFTEDVFTQAAAGNTSAGATLCYRFGSEEFQHYPSISMGILYLNGITSAVGSSSLAVVDVPEILSFSGYGISENASSEDRARWILSGTDCSDNWALISDEVATDGRVEVSSGEATFTFMTSMSGETPSLCYWFQDEPGVLFSSVVINVAHLSTLSAPSFGDADVAVVGYPKSWGFSGGHIEDNDFVRWIYNESSDCSESNALPEMEEDGKIISGETTCTFAESVSGRWITPCYRHGSEPWRRYSMPVYVKMVHNMTAVWGSDATCVVDQGKKWAFEGDGLQAGDETDLIKFVINDTDCASNSEAPLTGADSDGVAMYLETDSTATFIVESAAAGYFINLCYKFGNEEFMWYDIRAFAHMVKSVDSLVGGKDIAVVDVEEVLVIRANGTSSQDYMRWIVSNETSGTSCNDTAVVLDGPSEGANEIIDMPIFYRGGVFLANFTFSASSAGLSPILCYKFADEPWKAYNDVTIDVAMLQEVHANEGSNYVAVVNYSKMWTMAGQFLAAGDQVFWSASTCETASAANLVGDPDGILLVDSTLAPWFAFDSSASGSIVHICYKFNDEPFKEYVGFEIDIRMIRAVAVDVGSPRKAIPGVAKTFSFIGDGTATEAGLDQVKWVDGDDCLSNGITGDVEDAEGIRSFNLLYFDATGFTAQTIAFPEREIGGPYAMCYSFDEEPYQVYVDLVMTVLGISDVTAAEGAANTIVVGAVKRLNFTGGGAVEAGDNAVWVSGGRVDSDCLVTAFLSGPESTVDLLNGADFFIPDEDGEGMAGRTWTLCYRFGTESFKIYTSFTLTAVRLVDFSAEDGSDDDSVVGYPKTFHPSGFGIAEGDKSKWVMASVSSDEGCESDGVVDEEQVEWTMYTPALVTANTSTVDPMTTTSSGSSAVATSSPEEEVLSSTFTFTTPTFSSTRVQLCYKHQDEPYHLHAGITLRTRQLLSATIRELGTEQVLTSITNSPQVVAFVAVGGMEGDQYKWVPATESYTSETLLDLCADSVDPAAGSLVGVAAGFYQEASFTFTEPVSDLMLCYAPGSEPFMPYPNITMEALAPVIATSNTTHVIAGRSTTVRLIGTFGLTSGDALKLADNADGDCEGNAAGGDEAEFAPDTTVLGSSGPALGTCTITLYVSDRTEENRPYKLCYRFGAAGVWELFENVSLEAYEVTGVSMDNDGEGSPAAGDALQFSFSGTGIVDGDLAKWVGASTSSDIQCDAATPAFGSATATVVGGVAEFAFDANVEDWVLCYKHGSDDWRFYAAIVPVSVSSTSSSGTTAISDTQRTKAHVSFTMEGQISSYPEGSDARTNFLWAFLLDLARALGVATSRFTITDMRAGSVVVDFTIEPTGSLADQSVTELLTNLDEQISDESSSLRNGNVTSAAKGLTYTTVVEADTTPTDSSAAVIGLSVVEYRPKGLFGFTSTVWYTTEASGTVTLTIARDHGTKGVMDIGYTTADGSATGGDDYTALAGTVRFYDGDTSKTVDVPLVDDVETEAHFESFSIALSLEGPINEGAALKATATEAEVLLYDYGDGVVLADATFSANPKSSSGGAEDLALGWKITDNGGQSGWVDSIGFAAKDAIFGADEYDDRCDYAATAPCDHDCIFGGGLAELFPATGESPSVIRLNSTGYVTTVDPVSNFPSTAFSLSFWIRGISTSGGRGGGTVVSYVGPNSSPSDFEVLLHNLNGLNLLVHGKFVSAADRYDGPSGGDLGGIRTGIDVARDGAWHHVTVAWRSADGRVDAFYDGARVFDGGPYKAGMTLSTGGRLVLGQAQSSDCTSAQDVVTANVSTSDPLECEVVSGLKGPGGLEAEVQHLRLWSKFVTADEVAQQMHEPFEGNTVGQVLHWDFTPASMEGRFVEDSSGVGESVSGEANHGLLSENGVGLVQASPSLNPGYPCGVVHAGIWRFAGSEEFVTGLRRGTSYGGRLQFRLAYSAASGDIRSTRGAVVIRSRGGQEISWNLIFDVAEAVPGHWTHVSVVLREDHGWLHEPLGEDVTMAEMKEILANASDMLIRGDLRVFGRSGGGQEVVYLQDVRLLAKA